MPLAAFFFVAFIVPFILLLVISLFTSTDLTTFGLQQYVKLVTDGFSLRVLWDTLFLGLCVTAVCLLPEILVSWKGVPFHFGGTSLLIVVVVVMDFMAQLSAHTMSHHYPGLLKKANLLGPGRSGSGG